MNTFSLKQKVIITETGITGTVIGIWHGLNDQVEYRVRFFDSTGRPCDFWFRPDEIKAAE